MKRVVANRGAGGHALDDVGDVGQQTSNDGDKFLPHLNNRVGYAPEPSPSTGWRGVYAVMGVPLPWV